MTELHPKNKQENGQHYYSLVLSLHHPDQFVSTVRHKLRTPLTSIKGALGYIEQKIIYATARDITERKQTEVE